MQTIQTPAGNVTAPVPFRRRLVIAAAIGAVTCALAYAFLARPGFSSDFFHVWAGARTLVDGGNPYTLTPTGPHNPGATPLFYPLPALLLIAPLAFLSLPLAGGLFIGITSGLLAFLVMRNGYHQLPLFMSAPFLMALSLGQWSPLVVAAALEPNLGFTLAAKPNIGVAAWIHRPSVRAITGGIALVILSLVVMPTWPIDWLKNVSGRPEKAIPILSAIGPILALGVLRWRTREGRLFLALASVPQALFFYDQLLLWLIPRTLRQSLILSLCSFGLLLTWYYRIAPDEYYVRTAIPYALALYVPALALLLLQRHGAAVPLPAEEQPDTRAAQPVA